jgi:hypothetical protein
MAAPLLLYGLETWVNKKRDLTRIQAAEMDFFRSNEGCTKRDRIKNEVVRKELHFKLFLIFRKIERIEKTMLKEWLTEDFQREP